MSTNPYSPPEASIDAIPEMKPANGVPQGIGGWLILVAIGLIVSPLRIGFSLVTNHLPIFRDGTWSELSNPASSTYVPYLGPLLVFEVVSNAITVVLGLFALWHFFRCSQTTKPLVISWFMWSACAVLIDHFAGGLVPAVAANRDPAEFKEMARSLIGAAIWIPYFLVSKRVKATFIR